MEQAVFLLDGTEETITREDKEEATIKTRDRVIRATANLRQVDMEVLPLKEATNSKVTTSSQNNTMPHIGTKTLTKTNSNSLTNSLIDSLSSTNPVVWQVSTILEKMEDTPQ